MREEFLRNAIKQQKWKLCKQHLINLTGLGKSKQDRQGRTLDGWFIWKTSPPETKKVYYFISAIGAQKAAGNYPSLRDAKVAVLRFTWLGLSGAWSLAKFERILKNDPFLGRLCKTIQGNPYSPHFDKEPEN